MKKKIVIFLFLYFLLLIYLTEKILEIKNQTQIDFTKRRYIVLREHIPLMDIAIFPTKEDIKNSDSLIQKKYILRTDENGFIMPSKIHDNPDITVVFLGGSTTECLFVEEENRFPYLVGRILEQETGKKINSYNSGRSGNNILNSINILLNKVIPLKPHIVIAMHNMNSIRTLLFYGGYWNDDSFMKDNFYEIFKKLNRILIPNIYMNIGNFVVYRFSNMFTNKDVSKIFINKNELSNQFKMNLQTFINISKARKIIPVLMTQENRFKDNPDKVVMDEFKELETSGGGISYKDFKELHELFNDIIRELGKDNNVLVIDLAKEIPQEKEFMYDDVHYNDNGSKLAAQIISKRIKKAIQHIKK